MTFRMRPCTLARLMCDPESDTRSVHLYERDVRELDGSSVVVDPCLVCDATLASSHLAVEGVSSEVVVCSECGVARFYPMLGTADLRKLYPNEYYGEPGVKFHPLVERMIRWVGDRHISFLSRGLEAGARVLDVGCGRGVLLGPLADRGFETHGIELSAEAARGADPRAEIRITDRLADAGYPDAYFDEIVIWHVLEHLSDPRGTVQEMRRILKPNGRFIVAVPNFESAQARWSQSAWFHLDLPRHVYHFPIGALERMLRDIGFQVDSTHHFSLRQNPFGWIQSTLNRIPSLPRNGLYALLHRRAAGDAPPFDARTRWALAVAGILLLPFALVATVGEALARSGATVHVVSRKG